uniref:Uncharacterized protein n=1 Tax=Oryza nivara TaxID=4536 RepID=A0A0E0GYK5_ORYNI
MATSSKPKQGRIRVFLFAADDAPAVAGPGFRGWAGKPWSFGCRIAYLCGGLVDWRPARLAEPQRRTAAAVDAPPARLGASCRRRSRARRSRKPLPQPPTSTLQTRLQSPPPDALPRLLPALAPPSADAAGSRRRRTAARPRRHTAHVLGPLWARPCAPAAPPLRRGSASSPSLVDVAKHQGALPALAEEEEDMDIDTAAATSPAGVSVTRTGQGMRRSASSPALAPPPPSESGTAAVTSTSSSSSSGDGVQFAPVRALRIGGAAKRDDADRRGGGPGAHWHTTLLPPPPENNGERRRAEAVNGSAADESVVEELGDADQEASTGEGATASPSTTSMGELLSSPPNGTTN